MFRDSQTSIYNDVLIAPWVNFPLVPNYPSWQFTQLPTEQAGPSGPSGPYQPTPKIGKLER